MKYKRDYKIEIRAGVHDECFWIGKHKGENLRDVEDYETILQMLDETRDCVTRAIRRIKMENGESEVFLDSTALLHRVLNNTK